MSSNINPPNRDFMNFALTKHKNGDVELVGNCWQGKHFKSVVNIKFDFSEAKTNVKVARNKFLGEPTIDLLTKYECCIRALKEAVKLKLLDE